MHMAELASEEWEKYWQGHLRHRPKGSSACAMFFTKLALHVPLDEMTTVQLYVLLLYPLHLRFSVVSTEATLRGLSVLS